MKQNERAGRRQAISRKHEGFSYPAQPL